jgi:ubiquinone/menaquinone biosynthesis C-methylase UbiE
MLETDETAAVFDQWVEALSRQDDVSCISAARRFAHEEAAYDAQYGRADDAVPLQCGQGAVELMRRYDADFSGPAMEVGCGTGLLSAGLVASGAYPRVMLTDPSPVFLRITRDKLRRAGIEESRVRYAVLIGEDLDRLPQAMFSLIILRSTLHHVNDCDAFIAAAARALRPGGVLAFQEPVADGFAFMGAVAQFLPLVAEASGTPLTSRQRQQIDYFVQTMQFQVRRDVDKSQAEDKHAFRPHEVIRAGDRAGLEMDFRPNGDFVHWAPGAPLPKRDGAFSFAGMLRDYLKYCMNYGDTFTSLLQGAFAPYLELAESLSRNGDGPAVTGVFIGRRRA